MTKNIILNDPEHDNTSNSKKVLLVDSTGTPYTPGSPITYTTRLDEVSASVSYVGKAVVGSLEASAVWQIQKIEESGTLLTIKFANGNTNFNNVWNDRLTLTYE